VYKKIVACWIRSQQVALGWNKLSLFFIIVCAWGSLKLPCNGDSQPWTITIVGEIQVPFFCIDCCQRICVFLNEDEIDELE